MTEKDSAAMAGLTEKLRAANEAKALRRDGEEKHAPLPWTFDEHGGCFYVWGRGQAMVADGDAEEAWLARMRGVGRGATDAEQKANAAFIIRACNAHEALVEALKNAQEALANVTAQAGLCADKIGSARQAEWLRGEVRAEVRSGHSAINAAIAKATGR